MATHRTAGLVCMVAASLPLQSSLLVAVVELRKPEEGVRGDKASQQRARRKMCNVEGRVKEGGVESLAYGAACCAFGPLTDDDAVASFCPSSVWFEHFVVLGGREPQSVPYIEASAITTNCINLDQTGRSRVFIFSPNIL